MKMKSIQSRPKQSKIRRGKEKKRRRKARGRRRCDGWGGKPDAAGGGLRHREGNERQSPSIRVSLRSVVLPLFRCLSVLQTEFYLCLGQNYSVWLLVAETRSDDPSDSNEPRANSVLSCMQWTEMGPVTP